MPSRSTVSKQTHFLQRKEKPGKMAAWPNGLGVCQNTTDGDKNHKAANRLTQHSTWLITDGDPDSAPTATVGAFQLQVCSVLHSGGNLFFLFVVFLGTK